MDLMEEERYILGGGGSGAGSINVFYKGSIEKERNIIASGGAGGSTRNYGYSGGNGGNGSITIGNISTGTFIKDE